MNVVHFGEGACEKVRRYMDSYISNELLVETNHEVLRHLEHCPGCTAELETRTRLRNRLKLAVTAQPVPPDLQVRVRERVRRRSSRWRPGGEGIKWAMALAAALVLSVGAWTSRDWFILPALSDRPGQDAFIQRVSDRIAAVLRVGLKDHIHCAVFRKYPKNPPDAERMVRDLGPDYSGLLPLVKARIPANYHVVMAHRCGYKGRRYVHFAMTDGDHLVSLVISRKEPGESLARLGVAVSPSGIPVYQASTRRFEVAAFENQQYLAFVVSEMKGRQNLEMAASLAPTVHAFLNDVRG